MTVVASTGLNESGSAPYFSSLTSWVACACPPMLLIWTWPPGMASWVCSAETTFPSSTIAVLSSTWSSALELAPGRYLLACVSVSVPNALVALPLRVRLTTYWALVLSIPTASDVTSVPRMTAGPRTYFAPLAPQDTIWLLGSSHCGSV